MPQEFQKRLRLSVVNGYARASRGYALALLAVGAYWLAMFAATHLPVGALIYQLHVSDKVLHFAGFLGLALLLPTALSSCRPVGGLALAAIGVLAIAYGGLDELTQGPVGRQSDVEDWIADALGVITGLLAFVALRAAYRALANRESSEPASSVAVRSSASAHDSAARRSSETTRSFAPARRAA
jgi:VanZ family protein